MSCCKVKTAAESLDFRMVNGSFDILGRHARWKSSSSSEEMTTVSACVSETGKTSHRLSILLVSRLATRLVHSGNSTNTFVPFEAKHRLTQLVSANPEDGVDTMSISPDVLGSGDTNNNVPDATIRPVLLSKTPYCCTYKRFSLLM